MIRGFIRKSTRRLVWACLLVVVLCGCWVDSREFGEQPEIHGVWVQARSIGTPERADEVLAQAALGNLDAVFVNVFVYGHAYYESVLLKKHPAVAADYDPLGYVIEQAHQQGIAVHAWLVAGPVGYGDGPGPILLAHPDWAMVGPDGQQRFWLNYTRADVREFIGDLVLELVENYDLDGIHFDYLRYPGAGWGFDAYSARQFNQEYGTDLDLLRYAELPAYATLESNPLAGVDTAQVLASFDNGLPALVLNCYGSGKALLLNWSASDRVVAASSEILRRGIDYLLGPNGEVHILRSETNAARYGSDIFDKGVTWLEDIGWQPTETTEQDIGSLGGDDVLVLPNVYLIDAPVAADLADFVERGGGVIFIDGPTPSNKDKNLQAVTGMETRGRYFRAAALLTATQEHPIVPTSDRTLTQADYRTLHTQWNAFRQEGIDQLLAEVYGQVKERAPQVLATITVSGDQEQLAQEHLLDWQAWLEGNYIDLVIPRAYVDDDEPLAPVVADWRPAMKGSDRIVLGLQVYTREQDDEPKEAGRVLDEVALALASGSNGILLFDLERIGSETLIALTAGPFSSLDSPSR